MRKIILLTMFFLLLMPGALSAQDLKVGVVDLQYVLEKSEPGKRAILLLQEEQRDLQRTLNERESELDRMHEELQQQSVVLSQEAQQNKEAEFQQKVQEFQQMYQEYQRRMQAKEHELRDPIIDKLVDVIQDYGQEHGFDIILDKQNSGLVYNTQELELTEIIMEKLDQKWQENQD